MVSLEALKDIRFLQDLSDDHLQRLASLAEIQEFPAGDVVFREGQSSSSMYLVIRGKIALDLNVPTRGAMQFQTVDPGEPLGWAPVLGLGSMTATASAQAPSTLLALDAARLRAFCADDPSFGFALMQRIARMLASRLSATRLLLMELYREDQLPSRQDRIA